MTTTERNRRISEGLRLAWKRRKGNAMNAEQFDTMAKELKLQVKANHRLRAALLPFAAAAGRPGRLSDCMTDSPLADDAVLALGVKVSAWKKAIKLTGADDPPDCAFASPEDPRWDALGDNPDWRIGQNCKPKYRTHPLFSCAHNCVIIGTRASSLHKDGLLLIAVDDGRQLLESAEDWTTASGTAQPLTCANCGEVSTNPGQFTIDGQWLCTEACRKELCDKQSCLP